ncbi:hypothetical protein BDR04DRAFT_573821 [Suillus decipiens]|nr:hypothetical protein BDR04DRAFT_573821 [Suillus decipiens]
MIHRIEIQLSFRSYGFGSILRCPSYRECLSRNAPRCSDAHVALPRQRSDAKHDYYWGTRGTPISKLRTRALSFAHGRVWTSTLFITYGLAALTEQYWYICSAVILPSDPMSSWGVATVSGHALS